MIKDFAQDLKKASSELLYVGATDELLNESFSVLKYCDKDYAQRVVEQLVEGFDVKDQDELF